MTTQLLKEAGGNWDLATWKLMCGERCFTQMSEETQAEWTRIYEEGLDKPEGHPVEARVAELWQEHQILRLVEPYRKQMDKPALVTARLLRGAEMQGEREIRFASGVVIDAGWERVFAAEGLYLASLLPRLSAHAWSRLEGQLLHRDELEPSELPRERLTPYYRRRDLVDWAVTCEQLMRVARSLRLLDDSHKVKE